MHMILVVASMLSMVQEKEDPRFKYWSSCKVGSWVKTKMALNQGGQNGEMVQIQKLVEIGEEKVTLEVSGSMTMAGREMQIPARKQEIKAKTPEGDVKIEKEGDEEIEVGGKSLKCHWVEFELKTPPSQSRMKVWLNSDIPGGAA
ncbi:MAG TPA: hypothetical protein VEN81_08260, partial [Planctomycetota bacterium]|nr:hypothetical protein [Planctomycetota bacterium]